MDTLDDIARLAAALGDSLDYTGKSSGHGRALKGDGVLNVSDDSISGLRIAVECRTGADPVTRKDLLAAIANRDAHAGLLLAQSPEGLPRDATALGFRIYPDDHLVVLHYDRASASAGRELAVALLVARQLARIANAAHGTAADLATLHEVTGDIETALTELRNIRSATTAIEKESDRVRKGATSIERALRNALMGLTGIGDMPDAA